MRGGGRYILPSIRALLHVAMLSLAGELRPTRGIPHQLTKTHDNKRGQQRLPANDVGSRTVRAMMDGRVAPLIMLSPGSGGRPKLLLSPPPIPPLLHVPNPGAPNLVFILILLLSSVFSFYIFSLSLYSLPPPFFLLLSFFIYSYISHILFFLLTSFSSSILFPPLLFF